MGLPQQPVTISPAELERLCKKLSTLRHNVNNHLALIVAAVELIRRKPELSPKFIESIGQQPDKVIEELKVFSSAFQSSLGITEDVPAELSQL